MYCPECAHRNPDENRFCGMCGERLPERGRRTATSRPVPPVETVPSEKWVEAPAVEPANPAPPVVREERMERRGTWQRDQVRAGEPPASFLGLGNADYEPPEREISWRFWALMLLLLGVVALFGLQWRANHLRANEPEPKPSATQPASESASPAEEPAVKNEPATGSAEEKQDQQATPADKAAQPATDQKTTPQESQPKSQDKSEPAAEPKSDTESNEPDQPKSEQARAEQAPREFSDAVVKQADSFIASGQCADALRVLRGGNDNPKVMTKMGAMYLTGTCVQPDRVTAYAWFSQAFAVDPHNLRLESTRRMIWSQMTDEERARVEAGVRTR